MKKEIVGRTPIKGELYMGVEIEALVKGRNVEIELGRIHDTYKGIITGKHDGTVANNSRDYMPEHVAVELVSLPMTLDCYHNRTWSRLFERVIKPRKIENDCTLGGHIHMSLSAFKRTQLYKYMKFLRTNYQYVEFVGERKLDRNSYVKKHQSTGRVVHQVMDDTPNADRYEILNITKFGTLENRFFLSPFNRDDLVKNVEWCHALWSWCKEAPLHFDVTDFHAWLNKQSIDLYGTVQSFVGKHPNKIFTINEEQYTSIRKRNGAHQRRSGYVYCCNCNCEHEEESDSWVCVDDEVYCSDCVSWCAHCEEYHTSDPYYINTTGEYVCEHCFGRHYIQCERCGYTDHMDGDAIHHVDFRAQNLCESCIDHLDISWCEDCHEFTPYSGTGCQVCEDEEEARREAEEEAENDDADPFI